MTNAFKDLIKRQFEDQLIDKWLGETVIHVAKTENTDTTSGHLKSIDETTTRIDGIIVPITESDREVIDLGFVTVGDAHGYFKKGDSVQEKDDITSTRTGDKYRVEKIDSKAKIHGFECFTHAYLKWRKNVS